MILFIDDNIDRLRDFLTNYPTAYHSATAQGAIKKLAKGVWSIVFLDHDLEGEREQNPDSQMSGMEIVRWVEENLPRVGLFIVHSRNPITSPEMVERLRDAGYPTWAVPYGEF